MAELSEELNEMTEGESAELNKKLKSRKDEPFKFDELNDMLSQMEQIYDTGKYSELLEHIEKAISYCESTLKKFQGIGLSFAILSSQKWIDSIKDIEMSVIDAEELLLQAKRNFLGDMYEDAMKAIRELKDLTPKLEEEQKGKLSEMIRGIESHIEEAKAIGTNVEQAERLVKEAKVTLENDLLIKCAEAVRKAQVLIGEAGEDRKAVINEAMTFVEGIIEEARAIGADVKAPLQHLEKARAFFDNKDFQICMHTTIQAEEMTTELIQKQVEKALALKKSLEDRYKAVATSTYQQEAKETISEWKANCQTCGNSLEYVEQYNRWYCYNCQKYV